MAAVPVTDAQKAVIEKICTDTEATLHYGAATPADATYVPLTKAYADLADQGQGADGKPGTIPLAKTGPEIQQQVIDGVRTATVATVLSLATAGVTVSGSPTQSFNTTPTTVVTAPITVSTARKALVVFSGSFSAAAIVRADFYVTVGATDYTVYKCYASVPLSHNSFSGSWVVDLPAGTTSVYGKMFRNGGSGNITMNADDYVSISVIG